MSIPPNITALTAIDLAPLPASRADNAHDSDTGTTHTLWYTYTPTAGEKVVGVFGFGDLVTYKPLVAVFTGPASAPATYLPAGQISVENKAIQVPVTPGVEYLFRFSPNAGNPTPAVLLVEVEKAPDVGAPVGSILITDDASGFPLSIMSAVDGDDFNVLRFEHPFAAGEAGDILPNGRIVIEEAEDFPRTLNFYNADLTFDQQVLYPGERAMMIRTNQTAGLWWLLDRGGGGNPGVAYTIASDGTITQIATLASSAFHFVGNNDGTIGYYDDSSVARVIHRWDLLTDLALSDLVGDPSLGGITDILYLADDTVVVSYQSTPTLTIQRYSLAGATLNTYVASTRNSGTSVRLCYAIDDPISFWVFLHNNDGTTTFQNIVAADGSLAAEIEAQTYEGGAFQAAATPTPVRFGNSFSCPIMILRGGCPGSAPGEPTAPPVTPLADSPAPAPPAASAAARTLILELPRRRWFYDQYDQEAIRLHLSDPGDDVYAQLLGGVDGNVYQYDAAALRDDATDLVYRIWTPWPDAADPRGQKIVSDLVLDVDPDGSVNGIVAAPVADNASRVLTDITVGVGDTGRQQLSLNPISGDGLIARNVGLRISGTLTNTDTGRPRFYEWIFAWVSNWVNAGTPKAKFFQGLVLHADTGGVASSFRVDSGDGLAQQSFIVPATDGERGIPYSFTTPFLAHLVRLVPLGSWRSLIIDWIWEPTPENVLHWETQPTTHDLPGYLTVRDGMIAYASTTPVTWTITYTDGGSTAYTLPASGGDYTRLYVPCVARKGTAVTYDFVSTCPFQLFQRDCAVRIQGWGEPGGLQTMTPFGGLTRERGARI